MANEKIGGTKGAGTGNRLQKQSQAIPVDKKSPPQAQVPQAQVDNEQQLAMAKFKADMYEDKFIEGKPALPPVSPSPSKTKSLPDWFEAFQKSIGKTLGGTFGSTYDQRMVSRTFLGPSEAYKLIAKERDKVSFEGFQPVAHDAKGGKVEEMMLSSETADICLNFEPPTQDGFGNKTAYIAFGRTRGEDSRWVPLTVKEVEQLKAELIRAAEAQPKNRAGYEEFGRNLAIALKNRNGPGPESNP